MMRRIELLPPAYAERRRQRRALGLVAVVGVIVLLLLVAWWFLLGTQINDAKSELATVEARNEELRGQIAELQQFAALQREVLAKEQALQAVMEGDVSWPVVLTEIAMVVPGEVWLDSMTASAGLVEGATQVGTETAPIRPTGNAPFGRVQFTGSSLSMSGIGKWLIRLDAVKRFSTPYLNSAVETESEGGPAIIDFDSTIELTPRAASGRFLEGRQ
jgi:Tfp pilus assembly protein PilN